MKYEILVGERCVEFGGRKIGIQEPTSVVVPTRKDSHQLKAPNWKATVIDFWQWEERVRHEHIDVQCRVEMRPYDS